MSDAAVIHVALRCLKCDEIIECYTPFPEILTHNISVLMVLMTEHLDNDCRMTVSEDAKNQEDTEVNTYDAHIVEFFHTPEGKEFIRKTNTIMEHLEWLTKGKKT